MKICGVFILLLLNTSTFSQKNFKNLSFIELDTSFFDRSIYSKFFENDKPNFKLTRSNSVLLYNIANFNSLIKQIDPSLIIKPKFEFHKNKLAQKVKYFISDSLVNFASFNIKIKNGYTLTSWPYREGTCHRLIFQEFKNYKENGVNIYFYNCGGYILERQVYRDQLPIGSYTSYYSNGQVKEHVDSFSVTRIYFDKVPVYNNKGEISNYELKKSCESEKKGYWKTYDEHGKLIKEKFFE